MKLGSNAYYEVATGYYISAEMVEMVSIYEGETVKESTNQATGEVTYDTQKKHYIEFQLSHSCKRFVIDNRNHGEQICERMGLDLISTDAEVFRDDEGAN